MSKPDYPTILRNQSYSCQPTVRLILSGTSYITSILKCEHVQYNFALWVPPWNYYRKSLANLKLCLWFLYHWIYLVLKLLLIISIVHRTWASILSGNDSQAFLAQTSANMLSAQASALWLMMWTRAIYKKNKIKTGKILCSSNYNISEKKKTRKTSPWLIRIS